MPTSPAIFSSDDESHPPSATVQLEQHNANVGERDLLDKMTELIKGIAPSSCKLTSAQMWEGIQRHKDLLQLPRVQFPIFEDNPKVYYLNSGDASERIAELSMKLQAKFVQSETTSSYSIWTESNRQFTSAVGSRRPFTGISPGRRLSHLAKRRQMFSKANLQQLAQNEPKNRLAIKTTVGLRNLDLRPNPQPAIPKRALFQSPDEPPVRPGFQTVAKRVPRRRLFADLNKNGPVQELPHGGGSYDVSSWLASQPFVNNRKRAREDSIQESNPKRRCPRRSLDFSDGSPSQASQISSHSSSTPLHTLTTVHKQKLLWAVATALKEKQITHKHQQFKEHAKKLFNRCRKNLATILALQVPSGTTEKMLSYARQHIESVLGNVTEVPTKILIAGGKENVDRTPRRVTKPRTWRSCIKSRQKRNPLRLNRSLSCDDLKENVGCKRKRESIDYSREVFKEIGNTPTKRDPGVSTVIQESPEVDDFCVQASQEETESCLFPALVRNLPAPKSPDLFDCDEPDVSSLEIPQQSNGLETIPVDESACPEDMTELLDLSCIRNETLEISNINHENVEGDVEDNSNANESSSDDEDHLCTSTPMISIPKRILRRNKPAWKVEAGPGLKIRVRLSKEWDIVGRCASGMSLQSTNPEIDLKEAPVETQIKNPFTRLNSIDTTSSSTDNYNLMELRDKLQIEHTLAADPSEMSFFESSPNSASNSDTPSGNKVRTIVEISPEITINCYKRKPFSVFESDSSENEDESTSDLKPDVESEDENQPLNLLIEPNLETTAVCEDDNYPLGRLIEPSVGNNEVCDDNLPLSQLLDKAPVNADTLNFPPNELSEDENLPLSRLAAATTKQDADSEDDLPLSQLPVDNLEKEPVSSVKKLTLETYKARRSSSVSSEGSKKKIYNIRLKRKRSVRSPNDENANPALDVQATVENSERIIQQTFTEFACIIHQKMQSTISDSSDLESKIEKLNKLVEMSIVQQQLFAYFKQKTLEIRERLSPLGFKN